jgi:SAM-dependent methyltransferase
VDAAAPNSRQDFEQKFRRQLRRGWFRKRRYRVLSYLLKDWTLDTKLRKRYHLPIAQLATGRFLDLGCGLGSCAAIYARRTGALSVGVDFALPAVLYAGRECRRLGIGARYAAGDAYHLPFVAGAFDSAYIGQVLEHLSDGEKVVAEAVRVLKDGGRLIISVPKGEACSGGEADHVSFFHGEEDCRRLLAGAPLADVEFHPFHRHRFVFSARVRRGR